MTSQEQWCLRSGLLDGKIAERKRRGIELDLAAAWRVGTMSMTITATSGTPDRGAP